LLVHWTSLPFLRPYQKKKNNTLSANAPVHLRKSIQKGRLPWQTAFYCANKREENLPYALTGGCTQTVTDAPKRRTLAMIASLQKIKFVMLQPPFSNFFCW